jgi:hypothetical protein
MSKDFVAPPGGVMTDEVGVITGELTAAAESDSAAVIKIQYKGADEWYTVSAESLPLVKEQLQQQH